FLNVETDATAFPPSVTSAQFSYLTKTSMSFTFSEDVFASVQASDLVLTNLTTRQTIPRARLDCHMSGRARVPTRPLGRSPTAPPAPAPMLMSESAVTAGVLGKQAATPVFSTTRVAKPAPTKPKPTPAKAAQVKPAPRPGTRG